MSIIREITKRLSPFMKSKGFVLAGRDYYYIADDIAYCIGFDAPGGNMYVTAYVMPLYIPCESRYYTYGNRLSALPGIVLPILQKNDNTETKDKWCTSLCQSIEAGILPFFRQIRSPKKLLEYVECNSFQSSMYFHCPKFFVERLKLFTYLYLGDITKAKMAMLSYYNQIKVCTFFTDKVCKKYIDEIDRINAVIMSGEQAVLSFCSDIISTTKEIVDRS